MELASHPIPESPEPTFVRAWSDDLGDVHILASVLVTSDYWAYVSVMQWLAARRAVRRSRREVRAPEMMFGRATHEVYHVPDLTTGPVTAAA